MFLDDLDNEDEISVYCTANGRTIGTTVQHLVNSWAGAIVSEDDFGDYSLEVDEETYNEMREAIRTANRTAAKTA
jgi:hypothetical protein